MTRTDGAVGAMDGAVFLFFVFLGFSHCVEPLVYAYTHNRSIISFLSFFLTSLFFFLFFLNRLWSLSWLRAASAVRFSTRSLAPSGVKWRPTVRRIPFRWKRRWKNWTSCMSTVRSEIRIWSDCWPKVLEFSKKSATPKADWLATMSMPGACVWISKYYLLSFGHNHPTSRSGDQQKKKNIELLGANDLVAFVIFTCWTRSVA